ncbi:sigma-54-dependent transcriptional regulator [Parendozoicomonas haliclonae]|uniref:Transcriptional regulatory protein ZraR n=1 Tax=Parendozoicomonas haliclonae TaxID=1960125 RepID=A0A1X7AMW2_9GAMM|nr:sigma-54 dependent transcriptional regulator [Parendozoicomonas haliclonae]SMA49626.1 Transcriptional regulatory protein ZraR [Parendozoicomonas haliclonae]
MTAALNMTSSSPPAPQHILVVEDDFRLRSALSDTLKLAGYNTCVAESGEQAMTFCSHHNFDAVISDINLPGMDGHTLLSKIRTEIPNTPVILMTGYADAEKAVSAMRAGASDYLVKPFPPARLLSRLKSVTPIKNGADWIAEAPATQRVKQLSERVACTDTSVLITGESGTGKEVLAQHIHQCSPRSAKPFVAVNCAALPESMLESILFGHEKGAFTGAAARHVGKFEQACGGTLFLDEIAEMPLLQQAKLLRALQEKEIERLGSHQPITVNVRLIAATNRDLAEEVRQGRFREDLFYRLNVFPLHLPPLRERREDIRPLAYFLLQRHNQALAGIPDEFSTQAMTAMEHYHWPGNIRELDNLVQRACVIATGVSIELDDLMLPAQTGTVIATGNTPIQQMAVASTLDNLPVSAKKRAEYQVVLETLQQYDGNRNDAADALGITSRMLRYKLARLREMGIKV